jgi:hypothetical protein
MWSEAGLSEAMAEAEYRVYIGDIERRQGGACTAR